MDDVFEYKFADGQIGTVTKSKGEDYWSVMLFKEKGNYAATGRRDRDAAIIALIEFREEDRRLHHFYKELKLEREIKALQERVDQLCDPELLAAQDALEAAKSDAHIHSIGSDSYFTSGRRDEDAENIRKAQAKLQDLRKAKGIAA